MATYRFTSNVPTKVSVKYLDAVPGQYGPQMRINGAFATEGTEPEKAYAYLPGDIADVCNELLRAGVIKDLPDVFPEEGDKAVTVKITRKEFVIVADQPAGQKHQSTRIVTKPVAAAQQAAAPPAAAPPHANAGSPSAPTSTSHPVPRGGAVASALPQQREAARPSYDNPLYVSIVDFVFGVVVQHIPLELQSAESLTAMVNSLFIAETRSGAGRS